MTFGAATHYTRPTRFGFWPASDGLERLAVVEIDLDAMIALSFSPTRIRASFPHLNLDLAGLPEGCRTSKANALLNLGPCIAVERKYDVAGATLAIIHIGGPVTVHSFGLTQSRWVIGGTRRVVRFCSS